MSQERIHKNRAIAGPPLLTTNAPSSNDFSALIARLEQAAEDAEDSAFSGILNALDPTNRTAGEFLSVVDLALKAGAFGAAREVSALALQFHPGDEQVQKTARALSPPRLINAGLPADPYIARNQAWLKAHQGEYAGKWIALRNGELLGRADSLEKLVADVGVIDDGVLLTTAR